MTAGRPAFYTNKEELEKEIDRYFEETPFEKQTITGLALYLGFTTRQALINYECKPEFIDAVKRGKTKIENAYEQRLIARGNGGDVFALKNFDWTDKVETDNKNTNVDVSDELSSEQKKAIASRWTN